HRAQRALGEAVPGAVRRAVAVPAADVESVARARRRDIEETTIFAVARGTRLGARGAAERAVFVHAHRPERHGRPILGPEDALVVAAGRRAAGVGQEHDVGLESLGAVHGHDAHLFAPLLHVALDLGGAALEPGKEALERG